MSSRKYLVLILIGAFLFLAGGAAAIQFYAFPVLPFMTITSWSDVIIFSIISLIGFAILIFAVIRLNRLRQQT